MSDLIPGLTSILPITTANHLAGHVRLQEELANTGDTFYVGNPLVYASGLLVPGSSHVDSGIVGIVNNPSLDPNNYLSYIPVTPEMVFEATLDTSAAFGTGVIAQTNLGVAYDITQDSTSHLFYVDYNATAAAAVVVVGFKDPIGTVQGRVYIQFLMSAMLNY